MRQSKSPTERKTEWTNKWMKCFSEDWVIKTHQAKPIEMGRITDNRLTKDSKRLKMQEDKSEKVGWCHAHMFLTCGSTAETGQHVHSDSLCRAFNLKPWIWVEQTRGRRDTRMHTVVSRRQGQQAWQGLTPCDYFTLVNCCKCRHGEARMELLWTRCGRSTSISSISSVITNDMFMCLHVHWSFQKPFPDSDFILRSQVGVRETWDQVLQLGM